ncbi:MAG: cytochrome b N-terminal domain-containing protein [bacterium]
MPGDKQVKEPHAPKGSEKSTLREWIRLVSLDAAGAFLYGEIDRRLEFKDAINKALKHPVPKHVNWTYCFGGMTFLLFLIQALTGVLLTLYYQPSTTDAYESVKYIMNDVKFGWLIRSVHRWGAELMVLMLFLHMMRVYFNGAYKHPRELNWIAGVCLFALTMGFGFTGYLLPWDQKAYWGTTVGSNMPSEAPVVGEFIKLFLRGGLEVSGKTLSRFYSMHVVILPMLLTFFLMAHFGMIRRQGISKPM